MTERAFWETPREVSHDEARQACRRLINSHFRNDDRARVSIPANPDRDDDLVLSSYVEQQARAAAALDQERTELTSATAIIERQDEILTGVVNALRGDPPEGTQWSHHDAADLARSAAGAPRRSSFGDADLPAVGSFHG